MSSNPTPADMSELTVEQLLARQEAFVRLYAQHEPMIHGFVVSLVPAREDATEILQEVSLATWRKFAEFEPGSNFLRWACRIAEFEVRRHRRRQARSRLQFNDELLVRIAEERLENEDLLVERRQALATCLGKLRESDRHLLQERYGMQRAANDIAASWGRPADSIYKALKRIRQSLFACLSRATAREGRVS